MKKICSLFIAAAVLLSSVFIFTGCDKTNSEKFKDGFAKLTEAFEVTQFAKEYNFEDGNKFDSVFTLRELPGLDLSDSPIALDVSTAVAANGESIDVSLKRDDKEASCLVEHDNEAQKMFMSFPGYSDIFGYDDLLSDYLKDFDYDADMQRGKKIMEFLLVDLPGLFDAYLSDDYISSSKEDATSLDEDVSSADVVTMNLGKDEVTDILKKGLDLIKSFEELEEDPDVENIDDIELPDDTAVSISFYTKGKNLVKSSFSLNYEGTTYDVIIDTNAAKDSLDARVTLNVSEDDETLFELPVNMKYNIDKNDIDCSIAFDIGSMKLPEENNEDDAIAGDVVMNDFDDDFSSSFDIETILKTIDEISVKFTGTKSEDRIDGKYSFAAKVSGVSVSVPVEFSMGKTDDGVETSFSVDYGMMGMNIKFDLVHTVSHSDEIDFSEYDMEKGVNMNADEDNELVKTFESDIMDLFADLEEMFGDVGGYISNLVKKYIPVFEEDEDTFQVGDNMCIYNDSKSIFLSGADSNRGYITTFFDDMEFDSETDTYILKLGSDETSVSFKDSDLSVEINGIEYSVLKQDSFGILDLSTDESNATYELYSEDGYTSYTISTDLGYSKFTESFEYEMDDSTIKFTYPARDNETVETSYEIKDDAIILDGVEYEYYSID